MNWTHVRCWTRQFRSVFEGSSISYPTRRVTHEDNGDAKMGSYGLFMSLCHDLFRTLMHDFIVYLNRWLEAGCHQVAISGPQVAILLNRRLGRRREFNARPPWFWVPLFYANVVTLCARRSEDIVDVVQLCSVIFWAFVPFLIMYDVWNRLYIRWLLYVYAWFSAVAHAVARAFMRQWSSVIKWRSDF